MFADLAGFTRLTGEHGDAQAADIADDYINEMRSLADRYDAQQIKSLGDAVLQRIPDAAVAIRYGLHVVNEVGCQHGVPAVSVGIDYGPAVERGGDYYGQTINTAARVCALAAAGEVLTTGAVKHAAGEIESAEVISIGGRELKGIRQPVELYRVESSSAKAATMPVDPVCQMRVDPRDSAGEVRFSGSTYYFCSLECVERFTHDPKAFVGT